MSCRAAEQQLLGLPSPFVNDPLVRFPNTPKIDFPGSSPHSEIFPGTAACSHMVAPKLTWWKLTLCAWLIPWPVPFPTTYQTSFLAGFLPGSSHWCSLPPCTRLEALGRGLSRLRGHHTAAYQHRHSQDHVQPPAMADPALWLQPACQ